MGREAPELVEFVGGIGTVFDDGVDTIVGNDVGDEVGTVVVDGIGDSCR